MTITVYTKPQCVQCDQTKRYLDSKGIGYEVVDITADAEAYKLVTDMGYLAAPVVTTGEDSWSGFRLAKLNELADALAA